MTELTKEQAWGAGCFAVVSAVRYALGRMTYVVEETADWVIANWAMLPERVKYVIQRDVERVFVEDAIGRMKNTPHPVLGVDCDRKQWERVRALWKTQEK